MLLAGLDRRVRPAADAALSWAEQLDVPIQVTSVVRPREQQRELYDRFVTCRARGRWHPELPPEDRPEACRFPANPPGLSAHEYGLAWDSVPPDGLMEWWVAVREYYGWRVPPNDPIHAEAPNWRAWLSA